MFLQRWASQIEQLFELLRDYNVRIVLLGTTLLGVAAGLIGVYLLLRRRVLIGDAISHATLPGVALAYLWSTSHGQEKSLGVLLCGAAISGALGGIAVLLLRHVAKLREDAALGIVLSVFFGAGVALLTVVQRIPGGESTGLEAYIYGKAAAMTPQDVWLSATASLVVLLTVGLAGKELRIMCFDAQLARSQGWPVLSLDGLLIGLVVGVTIIGLQAVGLILMIALLVVPASSARFWTHNLNAVLVISVLLGAVSCASGTLLSAAYAGLPSGAIIVLCGCFLFMISFVFGTQRGVLWRQTRIWALRREQDQQHFLRAAYEVLEARGAVPDNPAELRTSQAFPLTALQHRRDWSLGHIRRLARQLTAANLVVYSGEPTVQLTPRGLLQALASVRDHRLLEKYMLSETEAGVGEADREADYLEHGLQPEHLAELSGTLAPDPTKPVLPSPHGLEIPSRDTES
ncbi:MAG: metal ABC transporter permease [Planctomycetales bacterium]|nr:metal ABC transporter permease [Planctomycetales bacterium]